MIRLVLVLLLALILCPLGALAEDGVPLAKVEGHALRSIIGKMQEMACIGTLPGFTAHSGYRVRVLGVTDLFQDRTVCHQSLQTKVFIWASENGEEFPNENVWTLPLGCDWEFSRWISFPESGKWDGLTVLEFVREMEDDSHRLYHVSINPYAGTMEEVATEDAAFYPPNMGYEEMDWDWRDRFHMETILAEQSNELFVAEISRGRLNALRVHKACSEKNADVLILSIDQKLPAARGAKPFFLCLDDGGDWAFGKWTLTGRESMEAGYLGFTLVDRKSKTVRHILCNPWTAYVK